MTAPIGTSANRFTGLREFGQVTDTYAGYLQSGGSAYSITLPFQADCFQWWRYTAYGTAGTIGNGIWFRDFPAGDELATRAIADNGATGNLNLVLETTNGITVANTAGGFTTEQVTITGATTATPCVITAASHGLATNDRVVITKIVGTIGAELNNKTFVVVVLSSSTFSLYDTYGNAITTVGSYTSGGQLNKTGPRLGVTNAPITYKLTLGSQVMGSDNDVIYFIASKFNNYINLGDVA